MKYNSDIVIKTGDYITLKPFSEKYNYSIPRDYWKTLRKQKLRVIRMLKSDCGLPSIVCFLDEEDLREGIVTPWEVLPIAIDRIYKSHEE